MSQQNELEGFICVKIPSRIKPRNFIPWKTWKRQWVVVRRSRASRNGVELVIGRNSPNILQISADDIICRAESRTQFYAFGVFPEENKRRARVYLSGTSETDSHKWMSTIRKLLKPPLLPVEENEFSVSVIDNFFSKTAGLSGLYGTLSITPQQVAIVDPCTSKNKVVWPWTVLSQFHMSSTIAAEDKGHICTVVTSRAFPAGIGPIHLFCTDSLALVGKLRSRGRSSSLVSSPEERLLAPHRHHTFSYNIPDKQPSPSLRSESKDSCPTPRSMLSNRRLSRSEGNLLSALRQLDTRLYAFLDNHGSCHDRTCESKEKTSYGSSEYLIKKINVAPGIISAGLGLILSTPGGSEGDSESLHEYLRLHHDDTDDELPSLSFNVSSDKFSPPRRESGVSIASGVYEEIDEVPIDIFRDYPDIEAEKPPPLPPRRELKNITEVDAKERISNTLKVPGFLNLLPPSPSLSEGRSSKSSNEALFSKPSSWNEECHYLPMLPGCGFSRSNSGSDFASESMEDPNYMVMASIKGS